MSYLNVPRICFQGNCRFAGPTRNNLLAALDNPSIFDQQPGWNFSEGANSDFRLDGCLVNAVWDALGNLVSDPAVNVVVGASVLGTGKMADLDPEHRRVTDLIGMAPSLTLPDDGSGAQPAGVSGTLAITQLRDYWSSHSRVAVTAWQSVLLDPLWAGAIERSVVLEQLRQASPDGLSIRLTPIAGDPTVPGRLLGVIGPWSRGEPRQFAAARRLIAQRPSGQVPFPVSTCLVDAGRRKLVADLSNMPLDPAKPLDAPLIRGLSASILKSDVSEGGGIWTTLDPIPDLTVRLWLQTSGIVEWDLSEVQLYLLRDHRLQFTFNLDGESLVMQEHPSGCYVDVDRRSLRLDPGESGIVDVYARRLGRPLAGQVVNFYLEQQKAVAAVETIVDPPDCPPTPKMFGYPTDPNRLMNSEPRGVLFDRPGPLQVVTDGEGFGQLTIAARSGEFLLPPSRQTIDSQLYFLGEPDGWQSWGAIGPNNGDLTATRVGAGCALVVLVFNTHPPIPAPSWDDIKDWLGRYKLLYPVMSQPPVNLDLSDNDQVERHAYFIYERLDCRDFEDVEFMPITRDLSEYRRATILAYLRTVIRGALPC